MDIKQIKDIAYAVNREDIVAEISIIENRLNADNKEIVLPLVGEFSSGKTSLINALLDGNKLETASKATTATIFEIYFGKDSNYAEVVNGEEIEKFENISDIKNDNVSEKDLIRVYDTSSKVPSSTILVDTPGLSSSDVKHKIALTSYLPKSDAIFLVTDINQQITRSLIDFVEDFKLSQKPIYLIINKCDTKTEQEIEGVKKYISENIKISIDDMVCVSAMEGNLTELYQLFDKIQKNKNEIVNNALNHRIETIKDVLKRYIEDLVKNVSSDSSLEDLIDDQQFHLKKINANIDDLIKDAERKIDDTTNDCKRKFSTHISDKLESIVANQGRDIDATIYSTVNQTSQMMLNNYSKDIISTLKNLAKDRQKQVNEVPLQGLETLDLSDVMILEHAYDMDLSSLGHKFDKQIGQAVVGVAATAAVAATIYFTGGATILGGAVVKEGAKTAVKEGGKKIAREQLVKIAKEGGKAILTNQILGQGNNKKEDELTDAEKLMLRVNENYKNLQNNETARGVIETSVGWITDKAWGKPQRKKAVRDYVEGSIIPEFSTHLENRKADIIRSVGDLLREEVRNSTQQMEDEIAELKNQQKNNAEEYRKTIQQFKEYIKILN